MSGWLSGQVRRIPQATDAGSTTLRRRVLLVEDDAHDRERILPVLNTLGFTVDVAGDIEEGLSQERQHEYAGAVVDLNLSSNPSQCEGFVLIAELRECGRRYPIVILSHNSGVEYEIKGFEAGADDYMVKWPQREEMRARLRRLMAGSDAQQD